MTSNRCSNVLYLDYYDTNLGVLFYAFGGQLNLAHGHVLVLVVALVETQLP